jgi:hypothetical protein
MRKQTPSPITTSPNARAGNIAIGISALLFRSPFAALTSRGVTEEAIGGGSGHTTAVVVVA